MKRKKNIKLMLLAPVAAFVLLVSSCGQAGFDVTMKPADTGAIDIYALASDLKVQAEIAVSTGNLGIDLSKIIYDYTAINNGGGVANLAVKLSLYGEATATDSPKIRIIGTGNESEPVWLTPSYENNVTVDNDGTKGWVSMIIPVDLDSGKSVTAKRILESIDSPVINQILKQPLVWIVADIKASSGIFSIGNTLNITNQSIEAVGSKPTGYFPGAFEGL